MSKIKSLHARQILDSRGSWTIEVGLGTGKSIAVAAIPHGKSVGTYEAACVAPELAVKFIEKKISPALIGKDPSKQEMIDRLLLKMDGTENKSHLGGNTILAVSTVCARASAQIADVPFWQYLRKLLNRKIDANPPRLFANIINGGVHASGNLHFQEYLLIPKAKTFFEATDIIKRIYDETHQYLLKKDPRGANIGDEAGFTPHCKNDFEPFVILSNVAKRLGLRSKIDFGLDAAASSVPMSDHDRFTAYKKMVRDFGLFYLEDPFEEDNFSAFAGLRHLLGNRVLVTGDDLTVTNVKRMAMAKEKNSINAIIIKPNQTGTVTETLAAIRQALTWNWKYVISHRSGETNDDFIADLAYGTGALGIKLGGPARGERVAKYNRFLEIERTVLG